MDCVYANQVKAVNATAVRLAWSLLEGDGVGDGETTVEGLYVWYHSLGWHTRSSGGGEASSADDTSLSNPVFQVATVVNPAASAYTLSQLTPNTRYLFFLVPFYRNIEGRPSNSRLESTLEAGNYTRRGLLYYTLRV